MDSNNPKSKVGHLAKTEKLSLIMGWSHGMIREHSLSCDHPIISDNFSVLAKCPTFNLRLLESIYIHKLSPNLNNHNSSCPLNILN